MFLYSAGYDQFRKSIKFSIENVLGNFNKEIQSFFSQYFFNPSLDEKQLRKAIKKDIYTKHVRLWEIKNVLCVCGWDHDCVNIGFVLRAEILM